MGRIQVRDWVTVEGGWLVGIVVEIDQRPSGRHYLVKFELRRWVACGVGDDPGPWRAWSGRQRQPRRPATQLFG